METTPEKPTRIVKTDAINRATYENYITVTPDTGDLMPFRDWAVREQVRVLRSIHGRIGFLVFLAVASILFSILGGMISMF